MTTGTSGSGWILWITGILLVCAAGGRALELLRATETAGSPLSTPMVHCRCASYPNVTLCSWPGTPHVPPPRYIATYSERHNQSSTKQCHLIPPSSSASAASSTSQQLWHCQLPSLKLLTDYIINVTAVYSGGSSSHLASFMLEDIVKPDPPVHLRVSQQSKSLFVSWSPPPTWDNLDIFPLKYQILHQWEHRGTPKSFKLGPFESTHMELKGLTPGRRYLFRVCAKELLDLGECSTWSSAVQVTIAKTRP
ncbi:interleukin-27 subunit beta [Betta splendens]|uniref:Interleukin-27 subunit beta n=1 Tax=Betta splendens TaxID=158456 RepID=A0A6P7LPQ9_BETSP|nr:interleukin-27 subunit beta [Betta splendens]